MYLGMLPHWRLKQEDCKGEACLGYRVQENKIVKMRLLSGLGFSLQLQEKKKEGMEEERDKGRGKVSKCADNGRYTRGAKHPTGYQPPLNMHV